MWRTLPYSGPERRKSRRWRPRRLRMLVAVFALLILGYSAAVLWLITHETAIVFRAGETLGPGRPPFPYDEIEVPRGDGARQFAWVMTRGDSDDGPWVLFLHGNAATIASNVNLSHYHQLRKLGLHVFAPEYRGFGGLPGGPTEASLSADARAAYDYLRLTRGIPPAQIVIYGWSLGAAVAVDLASQVDEAAVILEGASSSLVDLGQRRYPFFPIRLIMRNRFDSISRIDRIDAPVLFLHSTDDAVIPIAEGRRLFEAAREGKTFVEVRGGHVYASEVDAEYFYGSIAPFLRHHGVLPVSAGADRER